VIPLPASQQAENYPKDMRGTVRIAPDAPLGPRLWHLSTSQGATTARVFTVGELPEIIEDEIDGAPLPVAVTLPVTINGRIFPREDVDIWTFRARSGQSITCAALGSSLGSPLAVRMEVRDTADRRLAESKPASGVDAVVRFIAPADGVYQIHVHDIQFGGLQHYVYRLTLTDGPWVDATYPLGGQRGTRVPVHLAGQNVAADRVEVSLPATGDSFSTAIELNGRRSNPVVFDVGDAPEVLEREPNDKGPEAAMVAIPATLNGRIDRPGDVDEWGFEARKGEVLELEVKAGRLGSPLDSVLVVSDASGKELARADDLGAQQTDSQLRFVVPADGRYFAGITERTSSRGGPACAYRLCIEPARSGFHLHAALDTLTVPRGGETKLKIRADRLGNFTEEIGLEVLSLPEGVTAAPAKIGKNGRDVDLVFKADPAAPVRQARIQIQGTAKIGEAAVTERATVEPIPGVSSVDSVLVAVGVPTPFQIKGVYETKYWQRGAVFPRRFSIERNGYEGPIVVSLADKQARHLQGVTGPTITVPAGATEFEYRIALPPWMEIGRTSRTCIMAVGVVNDAGGAAHKVSFTSLNQNEQIVILVDPGQLTLDADRHSIAALPGKEVELRVRVGRGQGVDGAIRVEAIQPAHFRGLDVSPVMIAEDQTTATLRFQFADRIERINMPVILRATTTRDTASPVTAETQVEIVERSDLQE
jgi:hypothetical protein